MPLPTLPTPPSRDDPTNFSPRADAFLAALPAFGEAANSLEQSLQMVATTGTSTTSIAIGTGSKTLTTQAGKAWVVGAFVYIASSASVANLMFGQITAYNSTTGSLTVNVLSYTGSGTLAAWSIGLSVPRGGTETFSGTVYASRFEVDSGFALYLSSGVSTILLDTGDALRYNRGSNTLELVIGGAVVLSSDQTQSTGIVRKSQLDAAAPPGAVTAFAMSSAPTGWLKANGAAVSRSTYAALFTAIGTRFGAGDGATTFNLPDLRGEFVRGWDDARSVDGGRVFGSAQAQEIQSHTHTVAIDGGGVNYNGTGTNQVAQRNPTADYPVKASGGAETRPRNVALLYCIKF